MTEQTEAVCTALRSSERVRYGASLLVVQRQMVVVHRETVGFLPMNIDSFAARVLVEIVITSLLAKRHCMLFRERMEHVFSIVRFKE